MGRRARGPYAAVADRLAADPRVRSAAAVAYTFRLDPVLVLAERDPLKRSVREAATIRVQHDLERASSRR